MTNSSLIPVYIASKLHHADRWKRLRREWKPEIIITSRWIEQAVQEDDALPVDFKVFWSVDEDDIANSAVLIVFCVPGENLRGALVEAGMAIAKGLTVIAVGREQDLGTWIHHFQVSRVDTLEHAKRLILNRFRER